MWHVTASESLVHEVQFSSVQFLSCVWLFSTPWTAVRQASLSINISWSLLKLVYWVDDAIQPSHLLSSPSPAFSLSQYQGLVWWISSLHQVAKVLELQLQHQSFQWIFRTDFFYSWLVWSPCIQSKEVKGFHEEAALNIEPDCESMGIWMREKRKDLLGSCAIFGLSKFLLPRESKFLHIN